MLQLSMFLVGATALASGSPAGELEGIVGDAQPDDLSRLDDLKRTAIEVQCGVEELRQRTFAGSVGVRFTDRDWLRDAVRRRWEDQRSEEQLEREELSAKMLGMLPADCSLGDEELRLLAEPISYYDEETSTLHVLDDGDGPSRALLAASFAEALQRDLMQTEFTAPEPSSTDERLVQAAVEMGSNSALMILWMLDNADSLGGLGASGWGEMHASLLDSPAYVWRPYVGAALRGESFLRGTSASHSLITPARTQDMDRAANAAPRSTEQILHPVKYWKRARVDEPVEVDCECDAVPGRWTVVHEDTLGELVLGVMTLPFDERSGLNTSAFALASEEFTTRAAEGWGGDRLVLLESAAGAIAHLALWWDGDRDADEFAEALDDQRAGILDNLEQLAGDGEFGLRIAQPESDVVLVTSWYGVEEAEVKRVVGSLHCEASSG